MDAVEAFAEPALMAANSLTGAVSAIRRGDAAACGIALQQAAQLLIEASDAINAMTADADQA